MSQILLFSTPSRKCSPCRSDDFNWRIVSSWSCGQMSFDVIHKVRVPFASPSAERTSAPLLLTSPRAKRGPFHVRFQWDVFCQFVAPFSAPRTKEEKIRTGWPKSKFAFSNGYISGNMHFWPHVGKAKICFWRLHLFSFFNCLFTIFSYLLRIFKNKCRHTKHILALPIWREKCVFS